MSLARVDRRGFLQTGLAVLFAGAAAPLLYVRSVAAREASQQKVLVCVFLRGAVDGLHMVVPYAEPLYYKERPSISIAPPGKARDSALLLDARFGLHPKLATLLPLYRSGELAIVHAVGSPHPTRSHFQAQDHMETGFPGRAPTREGWVNRCLSVLHAADTGALNAIAISPGRPLALRGARPTLTLTNIEDLEFRGGTRKRQQLEQGFRALYARTDTPMARAGKDALDLLERVRAGIDRAGGPENGAEYPRAGKSFSDVARLIRADLGLEFAWIDVGGWDTHFNQGDGVGQLGNKLEQFGRSLAAFHRDLGPRMRDVVVVTLSEFGRSVSQNGTGGTDHGHGTAMFVVGGGTRGGRIHGRWPGLQLDARFEGRDLAVTTDFRDLLAEVLSRHLGVQDLGRVFPNYTPSTAAFPGVMA